MKLFPIFIFLLLTKISHAQNEFTTWTNKQAHPLKSDTANIDELSFFSSELKNKEVVGLGEASHGTHEFYFQKSRIVRYLISNLGYKVIGFEFQSTAIDQINKYLHGETSDLKNIMAELTLYNTKEILDLFEWMKNYNKASPTENKINIFGYDSEDFWNAPLIRDKLMAANIINYLKTRSGKSIIWAHNVHLAKDTTMARWEAMGSYLKKEFGNKYFALCFDSYKGSVNVLNNGLFETHDFEAGENSFSKKFAKAKYECFYISLDRVNPFYGVKNQITNINSNWQERKSLPIKLGIDFDGLIFIKNTTGSIKND